MAHVSTAKYAEKVLVTLSGRLCGGTVMFLKKYHTSEDFDMTMQTTITFFRSSNTEV